MNNIEKLIELFKEFPGIGPRQAKRFVYFLLTRNENYVFEFMRLVGVVRENVRTCQNCFRYFENGKGKLCPICLDESRDKKVFMIVSSDVDFENVEKSNAFRGYYFVLGGSVPILDKSPEKRIRQKELLSIVEKRIKEGLDEIIIALNYNPEGENTLSYLKDLLSRFNLDNSVKISTLGRGLSHGTELEYSDIETIKNALKNRQ
jgi:recombination protein RecR